MRVQPTPYLKSSMGLTWGVDAVGVFFVARGMHMLKATHHLVLPFLFFQPLWFFFHLFFWIISSDSLLFSPFNHPHHLPSFSSPYLSFGNEQHESMLKSRFSQQKENKKVQKDENKKYEYRRGWTCNLLIRSQTHFHYARHPKLFQFTFSNLIFFSIST